ncbi:MAG: hypothetical protein KC517_09380 [Bacteroidetes bacterium]|nr:hypothetical protein [Bacteroidota bacterium]
MNEKTWTLCFGMLKAFYGKIPEDTEKLYTSVLADIPNDDFKRGIENLIKSYEYQSFPKPATILKYCGRDNATLASKAILALKKAIHQVGPYRSVNFNDEAIHAAIESCGGWVSICGWSETDFKYKEKNLSEKYCSFKTAGLSGKKYLPGITEIENSRNGYRDWIDAPMELQYTEHNQITFKKGTLDDSFKNKRVELKTGIQKLAEIQQEIQ